MDTNVGFEDRYATFKNEIIYKNGMTPQTFLTAMEQYEIIRQAQEWAEFGDFLIRLKNETYPSKKTYHQIVLGEFL